MNYLLQEGMAYQEALVSSISCPIEHELTQTATYISLRKAIEEKLRFQDLRSLLP